MQQFAKTHFLHNAVNICLNLEVVLLLRKDEVILNLKGAKTCKKM